MGFSVSGSFAIIAVGVFIAIGMFYGAASNGAERVTDSQQSTFDNRLDQQNSAINITEARQEDSGIIFLGQPALVFEVNNTGSIALHINETDYLIDNEIAGHSEIRSNGGDESIVGESFSTDLWLPGETLHVEVPLNDVLGIDCPDRLKVTVGPGVSDSRGVTNC